jgi:hypothetical protein
VTIEIYEMNEWIEEISDDVSDAKKRPREQ